MQQGSGSHSLSTKEAEIALLEIENLLWKNERKKNAGEILSGVFTWDKKMLMKDDFKNLSVAYYLKWNILPICVFLVSTDSKDTYFSVPIHVEPPKIFQQINQNSFYQLSIHFDVWWLWTAVS